MLSCSFCLYLRWYVLPIFKGFSPCILCFCGCWSEYSTTCMIHEASGICIALTPSFLSVVKKGIVDWGRDCFQKSDFDVVVLIKGCYNWLHVWFNCEHFNRMIIWTGSLVLFVIKLGNDGGIAKFIFLFCWDWTTWVRWRK